LARSSRFWVRSPVGRLGRGGGERRPAGPAAGELSRRDQDFRRWWAEHDVLRRTHGSKRLHHPVVGDLTLDYEALTPNGDPDQILGVYTAEPGSASEQALRLLASWTSEPATMPRPNPAVLDPQAGAG
jgi:hypothetical protein